MEAKITNCSDFGCRNAIVRNRQYFGQRKLVREQHSRTAPGPQPGGFPPRKGRAMRHYHLSASIIALVLSLAGCATQVAEAPRKLWMPREDKSEFALGRSPSLDIMSEEESPPKVDPAAAQDFRDKMKAMFNIADSTAWGHGWGPVVCQTKSGPPDNEDIASSTHTDMVLMGCDFVITLTGDGKKQTEDLIGPGNVEMTFPRDSVLHPKHHERTLAVFKIEDNSGNPHWYLLTEHHVLKWNSASSRHLMVMQHFHEEGGISLPIGPNALLVVDENTGESPAPATGILTFDSERGEFRVIKFDRTWSNVEARSIVRDKKGRFVVAGRRADGLTAVIVVEETGRLAETVLPGPDAKPGQKTTIVQSQ